MKKQMNGKKTMRREKVKMNREKTLTSLALNRLRQPMLTNNIYCRKYCCTVVVNILFITPVNLMSYSWVMFC